MEKKLTAKNDIVVGRSGKEIRKSENKIIKKAKGVQRRLKILELKTKSKTNWAVTKMFHTLPLFHTIILGQIPRKTRKSQVTLLIMKFFMQIP